MDIMAIFTFAEDFSTCSNGPSAPTYSYSTQLSSGKETELHMQAMIVTPAVMFVDEAHECQGDDLGHYAILHHIAKMCVDRVKKVFLTGTPNKKGRATYSL